MVAVTTVLMHPCMTTAVNPLFNSGKMTEILETRPNLTLFQLNGQRLPPRPLDKLVKATSRRTTRHIVTQTVVSPVLFGLIATDRPKTARLPFLFRL